MIKIFCVTNLDDYRSESWPAQLPAVPMIGHCITSHRGTTL